MLRGRSWRARPASPALPGWSPPRPGGPRRSGGCSRVCAAVLITESGQDRPASPGCWGRAAGSAAAGADPPATAARARWQARQRGKQRTPGRISAHAGPAPVTL